MFWEAWDNFQFYHKFYHKQQKLFPPPTPSPPWRFFLYLRETQVKVMRGLQRFWGGCKDLADILEEQQEESGH